MNFIKSLLPAFLICFLVLSACNNNQNDANENGAVDENTSQNQNTGEAQQDQTQQEETAEDTGEQAEEGTENSDISTENKVFKLKNPQPNEQVERNFTVEGQAQVFEGQFGYKIVDENNNELVKDVVQVDEGNTESESLWRNFSFQVELKESESKSGTLILYTQSQADGSEENELKIPITFQ